MVKIYEAIRSWFFVYGCLSTKFLNADGGIYLIIFLFNSLLKIVVKIQNNQSEYGKILYSHILNVADYHERTIN